MDAAGVGFSRATWGSDDEILTVTFSGTTPKFARTFEQGVDVVGRHLVGYEDGQALFYR